MTRKMVAERVLSAAGFDEFFEAYLEAALFTSMDESDPNTGGEPLDKNFSMSDLTVAARTKLRRDAAEFFTEALPILGRARCLYKKGTKMEHAGHDFWLTQNGHGAGYWDGDWAEPEAHELTELAKSYGEVNLYVSRRKIHVG